MKGSTSGDYTTELEGKRMTKRHGQIGEEAEMSITRTAEKPHQIAGKRTWKN